MQKRCGKCGTEDINDFGKDRSKPDGLTYYCRNCIHKDNARRYRENPNSKTISREKSRKFRKKNHEYVKQYQKEKYHKDVDTSRKRRRDWCKSNPLKASLSKYKNCDAKRNLGNNLDTAFLEEMLKKNCTYCGESSGIGLDRIDNTIGHIKANVVSCCLFCNVLKSDMPIEAWRFILPSILEAKAKGLFGKWVPPRLRST